MKVTNVLRRILVVLAVFLPVSITTLADDKPELRVITVTGEAKVKTDSSPEPEAMLALGLIKVTARVTVRFELN